MLYYRVDEDLREYSHKKCDFHELFKDELLTERELERLIRMGFKFRYCDFTPVVTSKKNVYWSFGTRRVLDEEKVTAWRG